MAATGKKSKKAKWIKANLTDIIAEPTTMPTSNNWAASADEDTENYGYGSRNWTPVVLPSASRAARGGMAVDDESIPRRPPYIAHISNLPYDVDESAISDLFTGLKITNLRLPREGERLKGFGYVDFEDRESLVSAMNIPDLTISGRRIRIEVSTHDNDRRMGRSGRSDRDREYDPERTMGDWRSGPRAMPEPQQRERAERDRGGDRDRDRDRDRGRERERDSSADNKPGGWRDGERAAPEPAPAPARTPYGGRDSYGRDREDRGRERGYGGRDGFRTAERDGGGGGFGNRESRGFGGRGFGDRDRDRDPPMTRDREEPAKPRERPKLNLLPRTVPRESETPVKPADGAIDEREIKEKDKPKPVPAEKVFGAAKPVDTAAKEREIEERLRKQEEESRRANEEKERWTRRSDHSGERRSGARRDDRGRDDRGRDSRSFNRDRRDYSKEDKDRRDRRDYSNEDKDRRERRDYSNEDKDRRNSRERRDYSKEDKDRRNSRERRDNSGERVRDASPRPQSKERESDRNGNARQSRSRGRRDDSPTDATERPLPKLKEQEKPNFVASNKFSFLEDAGSGSD